MLPAAILLFFIVLKCGIAVPSFLDYCSLFTDIAHTDHSTRSHRIHLKPVLLKTDASASPLFHHNANGSAYRIPRTCNGNIALYPHVRPNLLNRLKSVFHKFHLHTGNPAGSDLIVFVIRVFYEKIPDKGIRKEPEYHIKKLERYIIYDQSSDQGKKDS